MLFIVHTPRHKSNLVIVAEDDISIWADVVFTSAVELLKYKLEIGKYYANYNN